MKVFISQPMKNRSDEEIEKERQTIERRLKRIYDDVEIINSFFKDIYVDEKPLYLLGKSFQLLANADMCYFVKGWKDARGCKIEHQACLEYEIEIVAEEE